VQPDFHKNLYNFPNKYFKYELYLIKSGSHFIDCYIYWLEVAGPKTVFGKSLLVMQNVVVLYTILL